MNNILISGAGIAGLSFARMLKKHGISFTIIEKQQQLSPTGTGIALPANAVKALRYMELSDAIDSMHQVNQIIYATPRGRVISQSSLLDAPLNHDKFVALERVKLVSLLKEGIEEDIHLNVTIQEIQQTDTGVQVTFSNSALNGHYQAVVGADGLYSAVRKLGFKQSDIVDLNVTNWRWVCEYPVGSLQPTYLLGMQNMFLAYPMGDNQIYCYAQQVDFTGKYNDETQANVNIRQLFAKYKGVAASLIKILPEQIYTSRLCSVPVPLFSQENMALIGDAGNACSPTLQQGAASAFEDAIVLAECLANFSVNKALELYKTNRFERVNWCVNTSDNSMKAAIKINSYWGQFLRNQFIKRKGPINVLGWRHLLSSCPLEALQAFIYKAKEKEKIS
jgi:2-polyprenyl-6-methoxyphenol hydroxylase-like FAD-dependent oxidoreductase